MTLESGLRSATRRCRARTLLGLLAVLAAVTVHAAPISMTVGEIRILRPGDVDRVAVGSPTVISTSLLKNGQLLVFGEGEGASTMHLWLKNGRETKLEFYVEASEYAQAVNSAMLRQKFTEIDQLIGHVPGLEMTIVGGKVVLQGYYDSSYKSAITSVKEAYGEDVLDLSLSTKYLEVEQLLGPIPGLEIGVVGDRIVLSGTIDTSYEEILTTVKGVYGEIMDLTRKATIELPDEKMVLMHIKITEFNKSATDSLGINWTTNFAGPAAAFAAEDRFGGNRNEGISILNGDGTPGVIAGVNPIGTENSFGYFGIATEITSRINLAVSSGDALILAEPRLVARSGGEASFLAGGEVPIEIVTPTSAAIEFKQFGILLNIKPEIDRQNNIRASVETEISAVDQSVAVGNTPGFLTRRTNADILLKSGETLVMSGLVDRELGRDTTGLKGLSSIPILGALFRSRAFRDSKTDLVIFVTPMVYDASDQQNIEAVAREQQQVDGFIESMRGSTFKLVD